MKKYSNVVLILILILVPALFGCGGGNSGGTPPASFSIAESLVPGAASFHIGTDDSGTCTTVNYPYYIAKYEVTYALWKEVYDWARNPTGIPSIRANVAVVGMILTETKYFLPPVMRPIR